MKLAGADSQKGQLGRLARLFGNLQPVAVAPGVPQTQDRQVKELLPGVRTDRISEVGAVVALFQPVAAAVLLVGPADGQIGRRENFVIDDRPVAHRGAHHGIAGTAEVGENLLERLRSNNELGRNLRDADRHDFDFRQFLFYPRMAWVRLP